MRVSPDASIDEEEFPVKKLLSFLISLSLLLMAFSSAGAEKTATYPDASAYADSIVTSTIDASICLDYSAGIEAGVYKWVASQDGSYYTLAAVDENGEPKTMQEAAINVGANNEERGPMGGFGGNGQGGAVTGKQCGLSPGVEHGTWQ